MVNFSMQQNPKDFEDLCEKFDKSQVDSGPNATSHESNVIFLGFSQSELRTFETNIDYIFTTLKFQMSKLKEQEVV